MKKEEEVETAEKLPFFMKKIELVKVVSFSKTHSS